MTALPKRPLGRAPLTVSVLGFGSAPLGGLYREVSAADAGAAVGFWEELKSEGLRPAAAPVP